jgi:molybdopterin-containing oxidoreductase family membrane subunit
MARVKVLGIFDDFGNFLKALERLEGMGVGSISTYSPVPCHKVDQVLGKTESPVRFFTLFGALFGFALGGALTILCPLAYPLIVGGKPLISIPPNLLIAFELTILFATILCAMGYFLISAFRSSGVRDSYDPSFSADRFGILVATRPEKAPPVRRVMEEHDAAETRLG